MLCRYSQTVVFESYQNSSDLYFPKSSTHFICFWNESMCLCVCIFACVWLYETWEKLIKEEKKERNSCLHTDTLVRSLVWFVLVCASDCLWSRKKRDLFPCLCFIQRDTHIHINRSIMNCVYSLLSRERRKFYLLIYFKKGSHQTTNWCLLFMHQHLEH